MKGKNCSWCSLRTLMEVRAWNWIWEYLQSFFPVVTFIKPWKGLTMTVVESHCVGHCTQEWTKCSKTYLWKEIYMASVIKNRMNSPLEILFLPLGPLRAVIKYLSSTVSIFRSQFWCYVYNIYSFFILKKWSLDYKLLGFSKIHKSYF